MFSKRLCKISRLSQHGALTDLYYYLCLRLFKVSVEEAGTVASLIDYAFHTAGINEDTHLTVLLKNMSLILLNNVGISPQNLIRFFPSHTELTPTSREVIKAKL